MSDSGDTMMDNKRRRSDLDRLDSWKAIANYFGRSVRTVRRWETQEDLPVHRHKHAKGSSVFAFTAELETWRVSMVPRDAAFEPREKPAAPVRPRRFATWNAFTGSTVIAGLALIILTVVAKNYDDLPDQNVIPITILLTAPSVFGGDVELGENLDVAIRRNLGNLGNYQIASPDRTLQSMRYKPGISLTAAIATEVSKRNNAIDAIIAPQIEQVSGHFVLSAQILAAETGELLAFPYVEADDSAALLQSTHDLAQLIDARLVQLEQRDRKADLALVTTNSHDALSDYTQAMVALRHDDITNANNLLNLAIQRDPEFVSALALRAWTSRKLGGPDNRQAVLNANASRWPLTTNEQLFFEAVKLQLNGDRNGAESKFQLLFDSDPDHFVAAEALLEFCEEALGESNCVFESVQHAELRPASFDARFRAARAALLNGTNPTLSAELVDRMLQLTDNTDTAVRTPDSVANALVFPTLLAWSRGETDTAFSNLRTLRSDFVNYPLAVQESLLPRLADTSAMFGRPDDTSYFAESMTDSEQRFDNIANSLFAAGSMEQLGDYLANRKPTGNPRSILFRAMTGNLDQLLDNDGLSRTSLSEAQGNVILAMIAAKSGDESGAILQLQDTLLLLTPDDQEYLFVGHDLLSKLLFKQGQVATAINVLERLDEQRNSAAMNGAGLFWVLCQRQLATFYRAADREQDARSIENRLRNLLSVADEHFPTAVDLRATI